MSSRVAIAQPDITLSLDMEGVIRSASLAATMPTGEEFGLWLGRPWAETVEDVAGEKVLRMLDDARASGVSAFRQVTQRFPSGRALPIEYTAVRLGGRSGILVIGKNLQAVAELQSRLIAAQHAREQDYWKLREIETRSRLLFDASSEAVLVVRSDTCKVIEANPAAIRALGAAPGWDLMRDIAARDRDAFSAMLARAREHGRAPGILLHLGAAETRWTARASLMTSEPGPVLLLQLSPAADLPDADAGRAPAAAGGAPPSADALLERLPDGFVLLDHRGIVRRANRAFLDLVQAPAEAVVLGERIGRWLSRPGADADILLETLRRHQAVRLFQTTVSGELGSETEAEISATAVGEGASRLIGLMLRDVSRRLVGLGNGEAETMLAGAVRQLAAQVGRTPLSTLVRDTTTALEQHCVHKALALAGGKRTLAAELLGLSRQSLYAKMERYGMEADETVSAEDQG